MRLNLGCGYDRRDGYLNVDKRGACEPDLVLDLEELPWPWPADSVDEILLKHTLEHLGRDPEVYLGIIQELWRVSTNGATTTIVVPHPRHDHFINDPTHVRPITPDGLQLFSQARNREWAKRGIGNSPLGIYLDIDFEIVSVNMIPDRVWLGRLQGGELDSRGLAAAARQYNNVISEMTIVMRAVKERDIEALASGVSSSGAMR